MKILKAPSDHAIQNVIIDYQRAFGMPTPKFVAEALEVDPARAELALKIVKASMDMAAKAQS